MLLLAAALYPVGRAGVRTSAKVYGLYGPALTGVLELRAPRALALLESMGLLQESGAREAVDAPELARNGSRGPSAPSLFTRVYEWDQQSQASWAKRDAALDDGPIDSRQESDAQASAKVAPEAQASQAEPSAPPSEEVRASNADRTRLKQDAPTSAKVAPQEAPSRAEPKPQPSRAQRDDVLDDRPVDPRQESDAQPSAKVAPQGPANPAELSAEPQVKREAAPDDKPVASLHASDAQASAKDAPQERGGQAEPSSPPSEKAPQSNPQPGDTATWFSEFRQWLGSRSSRTSSAAPEQPAAGAPGAGGCPEARISSATLGEDGRHRLRVETPGVPPPQRRSRLSADRRELHFEFYQRNRYGVQSSSCRRTLRVPLPTHLLPASATFQDLPDGVEVTLQGVPDDFVVVEEALDVPDKDPDASRGYTDHRGRFHEF